MRSALSILGWLGGSVLLLVTMGRVGAEEVALMPRGVVAAGDSSWPAGEILGAQRSAWVLARRDSDEEDWQPLDWEAVREGGGWAKLCERARTAAVGLRRRVEPRFLGDQPEVAEVEDASGVESEAGAADGAGSQDKAGEADAAASIALTEVVVYEGADVTRVLADPAGLLGQWQEELGDEIIVLVGGADRFWLLPRLSPHRAGWLDRWPGQDGSGWPEIVEVLLLRADGLALLRDPGSDPRGEAEN